jgi:hypothetical protein
LRSIIPNFAETFKVSLHVSLGGVILDEGNGLIGVWIEESFRQQTLGMDKLMEFGNGEFLGVVKVKVVEKFVHEGKFATEEFALEFNGAEQLFNVLDWELILVNGIVAFLVSCQSVVHLFIVGFPSEFLLAQKLPWHRP